MEFENLQIERSIPEWNEPLSQTARDAQRSTLSTPRTIKQVIKHLRAGKAASRLIEGG
jgi:hypothetical protein